MLVLHNSFQYLNIRRSWGKDKPPSGRTKGYPGRQKQLLTARKPNLRVLYCNADCVSLTAQLGITARSLRTGFAVLSVDATHGERREIELIVVVPFRVRPRSRPFATSLQSSLK